MTSTIQTTVPREVRRGLQLEQLAEDSAARLLDEEGF